MITELYYGSIQLILKIESKNELDSAIKQLDLKLDQTVEFGKSIEYTFDHKNVPFAMRLERLSSTSSQIMAYQIDRIHV